MAVPEDAPPAADDPILDEWFPLVTAADLCPGTMTPVRLLGRRLLVLCAADGSVTAVPDTCPHRGAQLSLGTFHDDRLECPYHGWQFTAEGTCVHRPAHPDLEIPPACSLAPVRLVRAYELWWACLGDSPRPLPRYRPHLEHPGQSIALGPIRLDATGPRVVENFLDTAHFAFVHEGYLGELSHTEHRDHDVVVVDGELWAKDVVAWQPNPGPDAVTGCDVHYDYAVDHPYAAMLTKIPSEESGGELAGFSLLIVASPEDETTCRVWTITTAHDPAADLQSYNDFQAIIFGQDVAVVQSQMPKRLPLDPRSEVHQRADRMSLAYRRWLVERGIRYGTSAND